MEGKITTISIVVSNQARSLEFFTEKVGFEKKTDVNPPGAARWVTVGLKGQDLELALLAVGARVDPSQQELAKTWTPGRTPPILLQVADCRKIHQELASRGVEFLQPPIDQPWGTVATFRDPDGNLFSMNQPRNSWPQKE